MPDQPKLWEEPATAGQPRGHRPRRAQPESATPDVDTRGDNAPRDWVEEMVGALTDPLIVFPAGGWEDTLPEKLKDRLPLDRLAHNMMCHQGKARWDEATDLEALLYMYPLTLAHPMSEQWVRIYLYLGTKVMGQKLPGDIRQEGLSDWDMGELRGLKRWIRKKVLEARGYRIRGEKREKAAVVAAEVEQFKLF